MLLTAALASLHAQGFTTLVGMKGPKTVALKRILPATVNLNGKRIRIEPLNMTEGGNVRGYGQTGHGITKGDLEILKTKLITAIQKDNRFELSDTSFETTLKFSVTEYYVESKQRTLANNQQCTAWVGKIEVSYQALDRVTNAALDSENLSHQVSDVPPKGTGTFNKVPLIHKQGGCGQAASSANETRDELMDAIVARMARRAAPTEEVVIAPVPHGKLEALSAMAASSRWGTLLEEAEKMPKLPKPEDDSYRVYLIGLANEGLAYDQARDAAEREKNRRNDMTSAAARQSIVEENKDFANAQDYIDKAAKAYKDAIQLKPGEKEYRDPDARIEQAVKLYATIMRHKEEYRESVLKKQGKSSVAQVPAQTPVAQPTVTPPAADSGSRSVTKGAPAVQSSYDRVMQLCRDKVSGVAQLIQDHPQDLKFSTKLTFDQDLAIRKECGADAANIVNNINAQAAKNQAGKKAVGKE